MTVYGLFQYMESFTMQILIFMQYGLMVEDKEVVRVVLTDIEESTDSLTN